jgi:hypothetical protein
MFSATYFSLLPQGLFVICHSVLAVVYALFHPQHQSKQWTSKCEPSNKSAGTQLSFAGMRGGAYILEKMLP